MPCNPGSQYKMFCWWENEKQFMVQTWSWYLKLRTDETKASEKPQKSKLLLNASIDGYNLDTADIDLCWFVELRRNRRLIYMSGRHTATSASTRPSLQGCDKEASNNKLRRGTPDSSAADIDRLSRQFSFKKWAFWRCFSSARQVFLVCSSNATRNQFLLSAADAEIHHQSRILPLAKDSLVCFICLWESWEDGDGDDGLSGSFH